jgi:hypothetical protein
MAQQEGQNDGYEHPAQWLDGMLGIIGCENQENHINQKNVNDGADATPWQGHGGESDSNDGGETGEHDRNFPDTEMQTVFRESGMQQDDGRKVDKLRGDEGLHPEPDIRKPSEPFAQAGSGEADQEEDNCEPGGESRCGSGAGFIQAEGG